MSPQYGELQPTSGWDRLTNLGTPANFNWFRQLVWPWCEFKMQVWNLLYAARWKHRSQKVVKNRHLCTIAQLCRAISPQLRHVSTIGKNLVKQQYVLHMSPQYGELRPTSGWDRLTILGTPANFNWFRVTVQHLVVGVSQTLRHWTEGATYIRQGDHHVGHWPTFLVSECF